MRSHRLASGQSLLAGSLLLAILAGWLVWGEGRPWVWWLAGALAVVVGAAWAAFLFRRAGHVLDDMPLGPRPEDAERDDVDHVVKRWRS